MSRVSRRLVVVSSLVSAALAFAAEPPPAQPEPAIAHITYVAATSVYVDAGQDEGLQEGDELTAVRDGSDVATLKVTYVTSHRVSCAIVESTTTLRVGDTVRYSPSTPPVAAAPPLAGSPKAASRGLSDSVTSASSIAAETTGGTANPRQTCASPATD